MSRRNLWRAASVKEKRKAANFCFYCFRPLVNIGNNRGHQYSNAKTIDHFIPLDKGGCNFQYNMVICCYQCNTIKGNLLPGEFNTKISLLWQRNDHFVYSKQELRNIINQIKFIRANYDANMQKNELYYLIELPRKMGILEKVRLKFKQNEVSINRPDYARA